MIYIHLIGKHSKFVRSTLQYTIWPKMRSNMKYCILMCTIIYIHVISEHLRIVIDSNVIYLYVNILISHISYLCRCLVLCPSINATQNAKNSGPNDKNAPQSNVKNGLLAGAVSVQCVPSKSNLPSL